MRTETDEAYLKRSRAIQDNDRQESFDTRPQSEIGEHTLLNPSLLFSGGLDGRGGSQVRAASMLNMQRTHGNRPVQRRMASYTPSTPIAVQREDDGVKDAWWQKAYDYGGFIGDQVGQAASLLQGGDDLASMARHGLGMSEYGRFSGLTNAVGAGTGLLGAVTGTMQAFDSESSFGERVEGGLGAISGGIGFLGGFGKLGLGAGGASGLAAPVAGAGSAGAFGTMGAAIGSGGAVLGAGLAGWGLGNAISENTRVGDHAVDNWESIDKFITRGAQGLGIMDEGEDQSAILNASNWVSDNPWKAAALGTVGTALTAPISIPLAATAILGQGAYSLGTGIGSAAVDYGGRLVDWARN
jgi:hypothetical protein